MHVSKRDERSKGGLEGFRLEFGSLKMRHFRNLSKIYNTGKGGINEI
jgi:hypothetical protein